LFNRCIILISTNPKRADEKEPETGRRIKMTYLQERLNNLQAQMAQLEEEAKRKDAILEDLRRYLNSDKFFEDRTVQVWDVLTRIQDAR